MKNLIPTSENFHLQGVDTSVTEFVDSCFCSFGVCAKVTPGNVVVIWLYIFEIFLYIASQDRDVTVAYSLTLFFRKQKSIFCVRLLENGTLLSGGLDGKLALWDATKYFNTPLQETQVS